MKVQNMTGSKGNKIANQFVVSVPGPNVWPDGTKTGSGTLFQSYDSLIAFINFNGQIYLDANKWDYSVTTGKYRNIFLGENKKETERKIKDGTYKLVDLNG
jgi:hypothetical protein